MTLEKQLQMLIASASVRRFHTHPVIHEETLAAHQWMVATLLYLLTDGLASGYLMMAALVHDCGESAVGDLPSPVKRQLSPKALREFKQLELQALKDAGLFFPGLNFTEVYAITVADMASALLYTAVEIRMGNNHLRHVFGEILSGLQRLDLEPLRIPYPSIRSALQTVLRVAADMTGGPYG